jgi:hypothetical protein
VAHCNPHTPRDTCQEHYQNISVSVCNGFEGERVIKSDMFELLCHKCPQHILSAE